MSSSTKFSERHIPVSIPISQDVMVQGDLTLATGSNALNGLILFAHGSGSSRFSPRNKYVASCLNQEGLSTLLVDLLTPEEERIDNTTRHFRFDINMLSNRLVDIVKWMKTAKHEEDIRQHFVNAKIGLYGASTGGGAAIMAAAALSNTSYPISAIVSRGGRPDLASDMALKIVTCPVLLIVGGRDTTVIGMNEEAFDKMVNCKDKQLKIVPGATHLFEEKGKLEQVADISTKFFVQKLGSPAASA